MRRDSPSQPSLPTAWFSVVVGLTLLLGIAVHRPAFRAPLVLDDHAQGAMYDGAIPGKYAPFNLFDFVNDANRTALLARGAIPWWTDPLLKVSFFRPLSSGLRWIDFRLFGRDPFVPHMLSFGWWAAAMMSVALLLRRACGDLAALIGVAGFSLSPCHSAPLVWLANRSALPALLFGSLGLHSYLMWRDSRTTAGAVRVAAFFLCASLSGEYALAFVGYLIAIEIGSSGKPLRERTFSLFPAVLPMVLVSAIAWLGGYGPANSGFYVNPLHEPLAFLKQAPAKLAAMLGSAFLGLEDGWLSAAADINRWALGLGALGVLLAGTFLWRGWRRVHAKQTWLATGAILACVPLLPAQPQWRLLGPVMLGVSGIIGVLTASFIGDVRRAIAARTVSARLVVTAICVLGLLITGLVRAPIAAHASDVVAVATESSDRSRILGAGTRMEGPDTLVLLLRAESPESVLWAPFIFASRPRWIVASQTTERIIAVRTGPRSIEVYPESGPLVPCGPKDLLNTRGTIRNETWRIPGLDVEIVETDAANCPTRARLNLDRDADLPSVKWLVESAAGFQDVVPPPVGMGVRLES